MLMRALLYLVFLACLVPLLVCTQLVRWPLAHQEWAKHSVATGKYIGYFKVMKMKSKMQLTFSGLKLLPSPGGKNHG
jgi:hypothetical protein